ncbi:MAG: TetR/AcrR family transcriptional regulator [Oscillospiraceae bacterium]|nr:TetR/AcrR family transcriptional regulator [Oscillospiraceae bacterium]
MNRTKRKIFEISMELFAQKGYDATSVEEITAVVGVAKGTLYYHFSSKENIFNFLIEEGFGLLKRSLMIKTSQAKTTAEKVKAIILVQKKIVIKYENLIRMIGGQMWGNDARSINCRTQLFTYIDTIENIIKEGVEKGDIKRGTYKNIATDIFGVLSDTLIDKLRTGKPVDLLEADEEFEGIALKYGIKK